MSTEQKSGPEFDISEGPGLRAVQWGAGMIVLCLVAVFGWSLVTQVDQVARMRGSFEPIANVQRVESIHGGVLDEILVRPGDVVTEGQVLVRFDRTEAAAALLEAQRRRAALAIEIERLSALADRRTPDFSAYEADFPTLVTQQQNALRARIATVEAQQREISDRIGERQAELEAIAQQRPAVIEQVSVARTAERTLADLVARGLAPRPRLVEAIEQEARFNVDLAQLNGRQTMAEAALRGLQESLGRIWLEEEGRARERMAEAQGQLRVLEAQLVTLERRLSELELRSPLAGMIQNLPETPRGDVIEPGGLIARIVPNEGGLRFVARLPPRDIGFVAVGQSVRLKVDAFEFSRYGALAGEVERISPTTMLDERGAAFYELRVRVAQPFFRDGATRLAALPGMTAEGDVLIGRRSVFSYLWQPVAAQLDTALSER